MTGFGSATQRGRGLDVEVEVRSVNHRFMTLKQGLPEGLSRCEGDIEQMVRSSLGRGSVTLSVTVRSANAQGPVLPDLKVLRGTVQRLRKIQKELGLKGEIEMEDLLSIPSLWSNSHAEVPAEDVWPAVKKLVTKALDQLVATRGREGRKIADDLEARLTNITTRLERIQARAPSVVETYQKKLDDRIQALLSQKGLDAARTDIVKEVALHADRVDISEEIQRLRAHLGEFRKIMESKGQIGRRLDFLTQEMGRETNTIVSKGNDTEISQCGVEIKTELEKIKEQVENIE